MRTRLEITPRDGDTGGVTLWIAADSRRIVKTEVKLPPHAGSGTVVPELTKQLFSDSR